MIYIEYDITKETREWAHKAFLARKAELDIGMPTFCYNMQKKIEANRNRISMIDGTPINTQEITPRCLQNFGTGVRTSPSKLYVILSYLVLIEDDKRKAA